VREPAYGNGGDGFAGTTFNLAPYAVARFDFAS